MIVIDLSKQQALAVDPKTIKQLNFAVNLQRVENARTKIKNKKIIIEEEKATKVWIYHKEPYSIVIFFVLI